MKYIVIAIVFLVGFLSWQDRQENIIEISKGNYTEMSFLDDIGAAISGHIEDYKNRNKSDEFVNGLIESKLEFTYSKDSIHYANGSAEIIYKDGIRFIQLLSDFEAGFAPDLYILTSNDLIKTQEDLDNAKKDNLQKLKKGSGASYYQVEGDFKSVVIWCKRFNQLMGSAIVSN